MENITHYILTGIITLVIGTLVYFAKQAFTDKKEQDISQNTLLGELEKQFNNLDTVIQLMQKDIHTSMEFQRMILDMTKDVESLKVQTKAQWKRIDEVQSSIVEINRDIKDLTDEHSLRLIELEKNFD